tara:strand:- start:130 stop:2046 length:1917 start_codon:yes stop_codon:yes gene_type:complete
MPYKSGKLKGQLTIAEIRKLIKAHNKLVSIKIPPKTDRDGLISILEKNGYKIDHKKQEIQPLTRPRKPTITLNQAKVITKPKEKTELEKQKLKEKKEQKAIEKKKEERKIKKEAIKKVKEVQKKKEQSQKPAPKPPAPKPKPPSKEVVVKPKRRVLGKTQKPTRTEVKKIPVRKGIGDTKKVGATKVQEKPKDIKMKVTQKKPVKPSKLKFKLPSQTPKPVKIDKEKKPPKVDKTYKIIPYKLSSYPLNVNIYDDIRDIPAGDVFANLVMERENIFYPWTSADVVEEVMFYHILKNNKSTCALQRDTMRESMCKNIGKVPRKDRKGKVIKEEGKIVEKTGWECKPVDWLKKNATIIAERIFSCYIDKNALPIPISKEGKKDKTGTHANLLIFNPYLMTAEHFEPHGYRYEGQLLEDKKGKYKYYVPPQSNLKTGIDAINRQLKYLYDNYKKGDDVTSSAQVKNGIEKWVKENKKAPKFKYEKMENTCPAPAVKSKLKGFQDGDRSDKSPKLFDGVLITEIGGYCAMWSLFHLDLRLKTLKRTSAEVFSEMIELLDKEKKETGDRYIELMRGMSKYAWEQLKEAYTHPKYNELGATKEDFIKYLNDPNDFSHTGRGKVIDAIINMKFNLHKNYILKDDF